MTTRTRTDCGGTRYPFVILVLAVGPLKPSNVYIPLVFTMQTLPCKLIDLKQCGALAARMALIACNRVKISVRACWDWKQQK